MPLLRDVRSCQHAWHNETWCPINTKFLGLRKVFFDAKISTCGNNKNIRQDRIATFTAHYPQSFTKEKSCIKVLEWKSVGPNM